MEFAPFFYFLIVILFVIMRIMTRKKRTQEKREEPLTTPPVSQQKEPTKKRADFKTTPFESSIDKRSFARSIDDRRFETNIHTQSVTTKLTRRFASDQTYQIKAIAHESRLHKLIKDLPSKRHLIILSEILNRPIDRF